MKKLLILQGPPCSGKSTWAKDFIFHHEDERWIVINRDSYRVEIGKGKYTMEHEQEVNEKEDEWARSAVNNNASIILDNTNLNPKFLQKWLDFAEKYEYKVEYKQFYVSYEEAMKRSKARRDAGGLYISKEVMKRFYVKYYEKEFRKEMTDPKISDCMLNINVHLGKPQAVIVDLDGTIALHNGREPFEWELLDTDVLDHRLNFLLSALQKDTIQLIFLTGRPEKVREATEQWLNRNFGKDSYILYMRDNNDFSHGDDYKRKIYRDKISKEYNVIVAFEDSQKCIKMWREEGILCCAVANNDY